MSWIDACNTSDINREDVRRFVHGGRIYALYHSPDGRFYATDGRCTHEGFPLTEGLVIGNIIECPKHNGRFDYRTGQAKAAPACIDLKTYPAKVEGGRLLIDID